MPKEITIPKETEVWINIAAKKRFPYNDQSPLGDEMHEVRMDEKRYIWAMGATAMYLHNETIKKIKT